MTTAVALAHEISKDVGTEMRFVDTMRLVRQFIMDLERSSNPAKDVSEEPPLTGDPRWDAMIGGVVEDYCLHHDLEAPSWVFSKDRYLDVWWFCTSVLAMRPYAFTHTPAALSGRGVFIQRASLINV